MVLDMVFIASAEESMPLAQIDGDVLAHGIVKDLGEAIAKALHRKASFIVLPRKRSESVLQKGSADGVCYARPEWTDIKLNWSDPLLPNRNLLVAAAGAELPKSLAAFEGKTIGTVLGYRYPELDAELHGRYRREDAPNMISNIEKLRLGHVRYAVVDGAIFAYEQKLDERLRQLPALTVNSFNARCGFSPASKIPFAEVNDAIRNLVKDGTIKHILDRYR
ncbi:MAG TPA: transporter substrate-binding domain-containing protein [Burkholderiaceae bacterium]|jgi:ABC-type amino acid transport substrate-binding protein